MSEQVKARARFALFIALVLGLPAAFMAAGDPRLTDLGKLVMILSPGLAGLVLNRGLGDRGRRPDWRWVGLAALVTVTIATVALGVALAVGAAVWPTGGTPPGAILKAAGASTLTSVLEELGWSGGGLALAVAAFGPRAGVLILGQIWAGWHLIPVYFRAGLFPDLEQGPPGMILAFIGACLIYRVLLTTLRLRARTWLAGAAGHAAPNILLAAIIAAGLGGIHRPEVWVFFPAPGGLIFPAVALVAVFLLDLASRRTDPVA